LKEERASNFWSSFLQKIIGGGNFEPGPLPLSGKKSLTVRVHQSRERLQRTSITSLLCKPNPGKGKNTKRMRVGGVRDQAAEQTTVDKRSRVAKKKSNRLIRD